MKKIICLALVIVTLICSLASCASFGTDPEDYAKKLEEEGFYVELYDNSTIYGMIDIYDIVEDFDIEVDASWIDYVIFCENEEEGFFFYCYDEKTAKNIEEELTELTEEYRGYAESVIKRQGTIVYFGAEENWKDIPR